MAISWLHVNGVAGAEADLRVYQPAERPPTNIEETCTYTGDMAEVAARSAGHVGNGVRHGLETPPSPTKVHELPAQTKTSKTHSPWAQAHQVLFISIN